MSKTLNIVGRNAVAFVLAVTAGAASAAATEQSQPDASKSQPDQHQHHNHSGHNMLVDAQGAIMNANSTQLPRGCDSISVDHKFTVKAGRQYADEPGMIFAMDLPEIRVEPCSRITLTFTNEDRVRHQWMVHGLPKYLYPAGMFHIEASGDTTRTGTFIVPPESRTYLIHCDLAQHMEKGMRGQLVVGGGSGNLWAINRVSSPFVRGWYLTSTLWLWIVAIACLLISIVLAWRMSSD